MEKLISIIDNNTEGIEVLIAQVTKMQERIDELDEIVFDCERKMTEYEKEIVKLKITITTKNQGLSPRNDLHAPDNHLPANDQVTEIQREKIGKKIAQREKEITELKASMMTREHELKAHNNVLATDDLSASNDQLTEIQRERRVLVINDLDSRKFEGTRDDRLAEEAFEILQQHNPNLDVDDIIFVKKLKGYKKNSFRMLVEVSTADLAEHMVLVGRRNGANMRLGKPRSVRKFMKEQYQKCSDMNKARENGCGYYFRIRHGTKIIRVEETVKEKPSILEPPHSSQLRDEENAKEKLSNLGLPCPPRFVDLQEKDIIRKSPRVEDSMKETPSNLGLRRPSRVKKLSDKCRENRKKDKAVSKESVRKSPCKEVTPTISEDSLVPMNKDGKPKNTGNTRKMGTNKVTQAYMEKRLMLYYDSKGNFSWTPNGTPVYKNKALAEHYRDTKLPKCKGNQGEIDEILNSLQN